MTGQWVVAWLDAEGTLMIEGTVGPFRSEQRAQAARETLDAALNQGDGIYRDPQVVPVQRVTDWTGPTEVT